MQKQQKLHNTFISKTMHVTHFLHLYTLHAISTWQGGAKNKDFSYGSDQECKTLPNIPITRAWTLQPSISASYS